MSQGTQGVIALQRRSGLFYGSMRSIAVWIDGKKAGRLWRYEPAEFAVDPGEHTVIVSMDWVRSVPLRVAVAPGLRSELSIGCRTTNMMLKTIIPIPIAIFAAEAITGGIQGYVPLAEESWLVRMALVLGIYIVLFMAYVGVTNLIRNYWAGFTLTPNVEPSPASPTS